MASPHEPPVTDLSQMFPVLGALSGATVRGDLDTVVEILDVCAAQHPDDLAVAALLVARSAPAAGFEDAFLRRGDERRGRVLEALRLFETRWDLPDGAPEGPDGPNRAHRELAIDRGNAAERRLVDRCAVDPLDPVAWFARVMTSGWLGLGDAETARRATHLTEITGFHLSAAHARLAALSANSSPADAVSYARESVREAPLGEGAEGLVAAAHLDHCLTLSTKQLRSYLAQPAVGQELTELSTRVAENALRPTFSTVRLHSLLATAHLIGGRDDVGEWHLTRLGNRFDEPCFDVAAQCDLLPVVRARKRVQDRGAA